MPEILGNKANQVPLVLGLSLVSLLVSFFDIGKLPLDTAWVAISYAACRLSKARSSVL